MTRPKRRGRCVSCGKLMEVAESGLFNHHCSPQHEAAREAANRRESDGPFPRWPSWRERLTLGFQMMRGSW